MSAKSITEFSAELRKRNIARPNLYHVSILAPTGLLSKNPDMNLISMWCSTANTPQVSLLTNDSFYEAGVRRKFAYDQDYSDLTLTFYVDQDYKIKNFFDEWKYAIVPNNRNFNYSDNYTAESLILTIINQADKDTYKYEFSRIYPKTISPIELSYANGNAISTFSVDFVFEDYFFSQLNSTNSSEVSTSKPSNLDAPLPEATNDELFSIFESNNAGWDIDYSAIEQPII